MKDGLENVLHDRMLLRVKDYLQILTTIGAFLYGGLQVVRAFDRMNQQITILQQQVSSLEQMVVNAPIGQRLRDDRNEGD